MRSTHWLDVSEHNGGPLTAAVTKWALWSGWLSFRVCDGTYIDHQAKANLGFCSSLRSLLGFIAYVVFPASASEVGPAQVLLAFQSVVTGNHPRMVVMVDVESWSGHVTGDRSAAVAQLRSGLVGYLNGLRPSWQRSGLLATWYRRADRRRVIVYGNGPDLRALVPELHGAGVLLADYDGPADFPGEVARQYTSTGRVPGFTGNVDLNVAPCSPRELARRLGLGMLAWRP